MDSIKLAVWQLGDLPRLEELTAGLETLWRERSDLWYLQWTMLESAFVPIGRARWDEAEERLEGAVAINRRTRDPGAEILMLDALCWLHRSRGAYQDALAAGRLAVECAGRAMWHGWAAATLGSALLDLRAPGAAAEVLERGLEAGERVGSATEIARCLTQLAWSRLLLGAVEEASALAVRAEALLERVTAPPGGAFLFGAHAYASVARVLAATGAAERGERLLRPVCEAAERFGWHEAVALTELVTGICMEARGELEGAAERLAHAAEVADEHGIPAPSWEAHAALARIVDGPDEHRAAAEGILERVTAGLKDEALRDGLRERANL
jgi:tetratricopeptide (TPR) repeat protein